MILGDHGPQTTITEDLTALGMEHLLEAAGTGKKKKSDDGTAASPRQEIPVRAEAKYDGAKKKKKKKKGGYEEKEFDEDEEIDEDEDEDEGAEVDADAEIDEDADDADAEIDEDEDENEGAEVDEDEDDDEDDDPQMEAAFDVIESFQQQLKQVQEGDADARPEYDDLVGVIEAYEYISEMRFGKKGGKAARGKKRAMKKGAAKRMGKKRARAHKAGKHFIGGQKQTTAQAKKALRKSVKGSHGRFKKSQREKLKHIGDIKSDEDETGDPIEELVQNLADLREAVLGEGTDDTDTVDGEKLIEGLRSIHDTATAFYERIAGELQENEEEEIAEDDTRVTLGRHLEAIAEDARSVATMIAEDEADLGDAADDLNSLAADLDDAMEAMKGIE